MINSHFQAPNSSSVVTIANMYSFRHFSYMLFLMGCNIDFGNTFSLKMSETIVL